MEKGPGFLLSDTDEVKALKKQIADFIGENDGENKDHGIEMGYRFDHSPVVIGSITAPTPEEPWPARLYTPSTAAGFRAPHVWLKDGVSILDLFGQDFTIVDFTATGTISDLLVQASQELKIPLKRLHLPQESHARDVWQCHAGLVRPDGFVAWSQTANQSSEATTPFSKEDAKRILQVSVGQQSSVIKSPI